MGVGRGVSGGRGSQKASVYIRDIPPELVARVPTEQRGPGLGRDSVRLPVSPGAGAVSLHAFRELRSGTSRCRRTRRCSRAPDADGSGSAEMPSAARPFTAGLVAAPVSRGAQFAPLTLRTGVASQEAHEPPYPERYEVTGTTARLVNAARAAGGRVIAVGTTAVRRGYAVARAELCLWHELGDVHLPLKDEKPY